MFPHDAIKVLRYAVRINPEEAQAWHNSDIACSNRKRHQIAIDTYRPAIPINPESALAWNSLVIAFALMATGEPKEGRAGLVLGIESHGSRTRRRRQAGQERKKIRRDRSREEKDARRPAIGGMG